MEDYLTFIHSNYNSATDFQGCWLAFENYLYHHFPYSGRGDSFRKRAQRFENHLKDICVHETFCRRLYRLPEAKELAELQPRIFRQTNPNTSAHDAFASDYSRLIPGETPKEPIAGLINLLYTVRCNFQHGQKVLPHEFEDIRRRNAEVFALTTPLLSRLTELVITQFVVLGIFSYGTLKEASDADFGFSMERYGDMKIQGHLYDKGQFPGCRYDTGGWVHGCVLSAPSRFRLEHVSFCDDIEGEQFDRRLVLVYHATEKPKHLAWAYHFASEPDFRTKVKDGIWRASNKTNAGDA
jgi:gamma-glutamylcyclotransferase (GGCT)/AIG2-like uncharacterized protein YtfP